MASAGDRILLVENDPKISDLIARQTLIPVGYFVDVVFDAASAIKQALLTPPDLIIADLNLPGLSTKDLLVALAAQGVNTPLIVIANKGQEQEIIQAFRLGAADYLLWPARDAEVLSVVERLLGRVREAHDRQRLDLKLSEANRELQRKTRDLTAMINVGKAVVSIPDQRILFQKIVDGALQVSDAKIAWLLIREDTSKQFLLIAQHGLPEAWAKRINMPLDDGISGLVALSGETLSISGEPLTKFRVANLGRSACAVPIKIQREVIGMLVVVRKDERPVETIEQTLLEAISDYVSISLVNARLFRALNSSVQTSSEGEKRQNALLESFRNSVAEELQSAAYPIELLLTGKAGNLTDIQRQALQSTRAALRRLARAAEKTMPSVPITLKKK
ncbi:MAG TPA: response regulator [Anaerolineales bacterium]|nr:response regulator [Anaerolineales bacterium]